MTLVLELTRDEEEKLREKAAQQGKDVVAYALSLVRQDFQASPSPATRKHSVMEFHGVGRQALQGLDVEAYIREMRDEWDRPDDQN